jgi:TrpR-related protein YerC/YecD
MTKDDTNVTNLLEVFTRLDSANELWAFIQDLMSPKEIIELSNRWKVAQLLWDGVSYIEISQQTGMSSTTIARISKCLNADEGGYVYMLQKLCPKAISATGHHNSKYVHQES